MFNGRAISENARSWCTLRALASLSFRIVLTRACPRDQRRDKSSEPRGFFSLSATPRYYPAAQSHYDDKEIHARAIENASTIAGINPPVIGRYGLFFPRRSFINVQRCYAEMVDRKNQVP